MTESQWKETALQSKWLQQHGLTRNDIKFLNARTAYCRVCESSVEALQKGQVTQHIESVKHNKNKRLKQKRTAIQAQLEDSLASGSGKTEAYDLKKGLCQAMLAANIPWSKLEVPLFRQFLEERCALSLPDESTLRKGYLDKCYTDVLAEIKSAVQDQPIWVAIDETTDVEGRYTLNVVIGKLSTESFSRPELTQSVELTKTNAETVSRTVNEVLHRILNIDPENVKLLLSDAAAYMLKSGAQLKIFYPKLLHITCMAHAFHRVCECIRELFPRVNKLISLTKKVFLKAPSRRLAWRNINPNLPLPPEPIITRWGTWLKAALFHADNFDTVRTTVGVFAPEDSDYIRKCQVVLNDEDLKSDLSYIAANLQFLPGVIETLETQGLTLIESFKVISRAETAIRNLPGSKGDIISQKYVAVCTRNPDLDKLRDIESVLRTGEGVLPQNVSAKESASYKYAPLTSVDVERSFSMLKSILVSNRRRLSQENLAKTLICHSFYRSDA